MFEQNIEGLPSGCINGDEDWRRSTQAKPTPLSAKSVLKINLKNLFCQFWGDLKIIWRKNKKKINLPATRDCLPNRRLLTDSPIKILNEVYVAQKSCERPSRSYHIQVECPTQDIGVTYVLPSWLLVPIRFDFKNRIISSTHPPSKRTT